LFSGGVWRKIAGKERKGKNALMSGLLRFDVLNGQKGAFVYFFLLRE
jgi:hypothetical protein